MEIIVTSDRTALIAINSEARTGSPTRTKLFAPGDCAESPRPSARPTTRKITTGITIVPIAPSGSRRKILISIHVSFHSPCSIISSLLSNRMTSQFKKHVLKVRKNGAEIRDSYSIFGQATNHLGHQVVASPTNGVPRVTAVYHLNSRDAPKTLNSDRVVCGKPHGSLRAVPADQPLRTVNIYNPSMLDNCHPVAQPLGFLHQVSCQKNRFTALANSAHQLPDRAPRLRV